MYKQSTQYFIDIHLYTRGKSLLTYKHWLPATKQWLDFILHLLSKIVQSAILFQSWVLLFYIDVSLRNPQEGVHDRKEITLSFWGSKWIFLFFILLVGIISKGGAKPNIIPDITELEYSIRAATKKELDILTGKVLDCLHSAAKATGCTVWMIV